LRSATSAAPLLSRSSVTDLVVLTSSVYALDVTGQMKALLDHLCYMWISHRPDPRMFGKLGLTVVTTAGAGLNHTTKTLRNSLRYWCVQRTCSFRGRVAAMKWDDVSEQTRGKIRKNAARLARRISKAAENTKKLPNPLFRSLMFKTMSGAQKKNDWNPTDRRHWEDNGWLAGAKPW